MPAPILAVSGSRWNFAVPAIFLFLLLPATGQPEPGIPLQQTYTFGEIAGIPQDSQIMATENIPSGGVVLTGRRPATGAVEEVFLARYASADALATGPDWIRTMDAGMGVPRDVAADAEGNLYLTGTMGQPRLQTTPGAYQTDFSQAVADLVEIGYVIKLDSGGQVVYATYIGGDSQRASPGAIVVNPAGEVYISGQVTAEGFPVTAPPVSGFGYFVTHLNAEGSDAIYSVTGVGGSRLALDESAEESELVFAGSWWAGQGSDRPQITAGAYQSEAPFTVCGSTRVFSFPCAHQYAGKLGSAGELLFQTWISGEMGSHPAGIDVDDQGDIYLAGTTASYDYPVTQGAFQTETSAIPRPVDRNCCISNFSPELPQIAFLSKVSADGSQLLYSTFLSGSFHESAGGVALSEDGDAVYVSVHSESPDLPGLPDLPGCLPNLHYGQPVVLKFATSDFSHRFTAIGLSHSDSLFSLSRIGEPNFAPGPVSEPLLITSEGRFAHLNPHRPRMVPVYCLADSASAAVVPEAVPGKLLTLFGDFPVGEESVFDSQAAQLPRVMSGRQIRVEVNGIDAPLLYVSPTQINFVFPIELAAVQTADIRVTGLGGGIIPSASFFGGITVPVASADPSVFTGYQSGYPECAGERFPARLALVLNADGTLNSCEHPAEPNTKVTVFLNGAAIQNGGLVGHISHFALPGAPQVRANQQEVPVTNELGTAYGVWRAEVPVGMASGRMQLEVDGVDGQDTEFYVFIREP